MNKEVFKKNITKALIDGVKSQLKKLEEEEIEIEEADEPEEGTLETVVEVSASKGGHHWIVRRGSPPAGYDPKMHAMLVAENLETGKWENITLYLYDSIHSYGAGNRAKYYYLTFHGLIAQRDIPQYVRDAIDELAATLSEARIEEGKKKSTPKKRTARPAK